MRIRGIRRRLYFLTYDKQGMNRKALKIRNSVDEVKKILNQKNV